MLRQYHNAQRFRPQKHYGKIYDASVIQIGDTFRANGTTYIVLGFETREYCAARKNQDGKYESTYMRGSDGLVCRNTANGRTETIAHHYALEH